MYNGDFGKWPYGSVFTMQNGIGARIADGWYAGPGHGGAILSFTFRMADIGEPGIPFNTRLVARCKWIRPFAYPNPWMTFLEWGEAHGVPRGLGVRLHQDSTVTPSIYVRTYPGEPSVSMRQICWRSMGNGTGGSPDPADIYGLPNVIGDQWQLIQDTLYIPPIGGLALNSNGDDYFGYGLDILQDGYGHGIEFAMADGV